MPLDPSVAARLAENLTRVRARIAAAAAKAGRASDSLTLVAVTKSVGPEEVRALLGLGVRELGENRYQVALPKVLDTAADVRAAGARWRMIGHLQTNKARQVLEHFAAVDSVDSIHLLECLAKEAAKLGRAAVPCLAEVNVSGEAQKFGLAPAGLREFLARAAALPVLDLRGLMCMAPYSDNPEAVSRPVFKALRALFEEANAKGWHPRPLTELSMGMSADYEIAVEEGATMVRVGTALFQG